MNVGQHCYAKLTCWHGLLRTATWWPTFQISISDVYNKSSEVDGILMQSFPIWCPITFVALSIMYDILLSDTRNCKLEKRYASPVARNLIASTGLLACLISCAPITAESFGVICSSIKPRVFLNDSQLILIISLFVLVSSTNNY